MLWLQNAFSILATSAKIWEMSKSSKDTVPMDYQCICGGFLKKNLIFTALSALKTVLKKSIQPDNKNSQAKCSPAVNWSRLVCYGGHGFLCSYKQAPGWRQTPFQTNLSKVRDDNWWPVHSMVIVGTGPPVQDGCILIVLWQLEFPWIDGSKSVFPDGKIKPGVRLS